MPQVAEEAQVDVQPYPALEVVEEVLAMRVHAHEPPFRQVPGTRREAPLGRVRGEAPPHEPLAVDPRDSMEDVAFGHSSQVMPGA